LSFNVVGCGGWALVDHGCSPWVIMLLAMEV
jgi:hypothetical protein